MYNLENQRNILKNIGTWTRTQNTGLKLQKTRENGRKKGSLTMPAGAAQVHQ